MQLIPKLLTALCPVFISSGSVHIQSSESVYTYFSTRPQGAHGKFDLRMRPYSLVPRALVSPTMNLSGAQSNFLGILELFRTRTRIVRLFLNSGSGLKTKLTVLREVPSM